MKAKLIIAAVLTLQLAQSDCLAKSGTRYLLQLSVTGRRNSTGLWEKDFKLKYNGSEPAFAWDVDFEDSFSSDEYSFNVVGVVEGLTDGSSSVCNGVEENNNASDIIIHRHKFYAQPMNWTDANRTCFNDGGYLAIINSEDESIELAKLFISHPISPGAGNQNYTYIGFNDIKEEGHYVTVLGGELEDTGFLQWDEREPSNYHYPHNGVLWDEDCGCITKRGRLNDITCFKKLAFICEFEESSI